MSDRTEQHATVRHLRARVAELETMLGQPLDGDEYQDVADELHESCSRLEALKSGTQQGAGAMLVPAHLEERLT